MKDNVFERLRVALINTGASQSQLAREADVQQGSLSRFLKGTQATLSGEAFIKLVSYLGGNIQLPGDAPAPSAEAGRDVCFVDAKVVPTGDYVAPPQAEDYIAAPLVGEVGAGPGYLPQEEVKSWFLVYRNLPAVRYRRNLIAVEIGKNSTSMKPLLNPQDIVLVDRDDRDVAAPGHIMLVLDPDGQGMIKRVSVEQLEDGDFSVVYYSDNAMKNPPICYSLRKDFLSDWDRSIVGRVIWAWSDMREK